MKQSLSTRHPDPNEVFGILYATGAIGVLLPCLAGLVAIVMLWRVGRPRQSPSPSGFPGSGPVLAEGAAL